MLCSANLWLSNKGVSKQWHLSRLVQVACFGGMLSPAQLLSTSERCNKIPLHHCSYYCGNSPANLICLVKHFFRRERVSRIVVLHIFFLVLLFVNFCQSDVQNDTLKHKMFNSDQTSVKISCVVNGLLVLKFSILFSFYISGTFGDGKEENVLSKIGVATLAFKIWRPVEKAISTKYEEAKRSNSKPYCRHLYLLAHWSGYLWRHWVRRRKEAQRSIRK